MPGSIQFSYPVMSGTLVNGNVTISDDGGGYFQCNYNTGGSDVYKLFKPTNILFFSNSMTVTHKYNNDMLYVKYSTTKDSTRSAITADNIYLNKSIGDGIVITKKVDFTNKMCDLSSNVNNYYIDMTTIGPIPVNVSAAADNTIQDPFSTTSATPITSIPLSSGSFITDEIVCDSGTTDSSRQDKISSYQGFVFQGFGWIMFAMLIQVGVLILIQKSSMPKFPVGTGVFDFFNPDFSKGNNFYNIFTILAFLMSTTFFLVYGFLGPTVNNSYWYYLVIAIVFLFSFISFLLWKVMYLTDF
jgi:hypothetical protein